MAKVTYASVDDYIRAQPAEVHTVLRTVRGIIRNALPTADEVISYQIPAYRVGGRIVLYFAGWRDHFSLYPASKALEEKFRKELAPYETSGKGTIRFPMDRRIPSGLIARIARFRVAESAAGAKARAAAKAKAAKPRARVKKT